MEGEREAGPKESVVLTRVPDLPWSIRLRVVLDLLAQLTQAQRGTFGPRTQGSGLRIEQLELGPDGVLRPLDGGDATGVDVLLWEVMAGRPAPDGPLPRLHDILDEVPPDIDDVMESIKADPGRSVDDVFQDVFAASAGLTASHETVRRMAWPGAGALVGGDPQTPAAPEGADSRGRAPDSQHQAPAPTLASDARETPPPSRLGEISNPPEAFESKGTASASAPVVEPAPSSALETVVLITDGEPPDELRAILANAGYHVDQCGDVESGLVAAMGPGAVCVVCDLAATGPETFARRIRREPAIASSMPLITFAPIGDPRAGLLRVAMGADVCMRKPAAGADVVAQIVALTRMVSRLLRPAETAHDSSPLEQKGVQALLDLLQAESPHASEPPSVEDAETMAFPLQPRSARDENLPAPSVRFPSPPSRPALPTVAPRTPGEPSAIDVADAVLVAACWSNGRLSTLEPSEEGYTLAFVREDDRIDPIAISAGLGQGVAARLLILAGIDPATAGERLGQVRLRVPNGEAGLSLGGDPPTPARSLEAHELLVIARVDAAGTSVEIKRLSEGPRVAAPAELGADPKSARADVGALDSAHPANVDPVSADSGSSELGSADLSATTGYRILGELGRGGMGVVYLAEHQILGTQVALKLLHRAMAAMPDVAARFVAEGRAAARARHPGIVQVTDFGMLRTGQAYLVMELVEGTTLSKLLGKSNALPIERALSIAQQVAEALQAVHACSIVHRDIKPANVFVGAGDRVKIGDFGIAKQVGLDLSRRRTRETGKGVMLGTPRYMAPEYVSGGEAGPQADVYALGCMLFRMLAGHVPYDAATPVGIMTMHLTAPIPEPQSLFGPVPSTVTRIIRRAMAKAQEDRYPTAGAMAQDLAAAARGLERLNARFERDRRDRGGRPSVTTGTPVAPTRPVPQTRPEKS